MENDLEEVDLDSLVVDETTGEVTKASSVYTGPVDAPKTIRGSASLVDDYRTCPAKAYGRITRQNQEKSVPLILGTSVHTALEDYVTKQADPMTTFETSLKVLAEEHGLALNNKAGEDARFVGARCVGAGLGILNHKGPTGIPLWQRMDPEFIEKYFIVERNGRTYSGKIDFVTFLNDNPSYVIGDWKTGKNAPSPYKLRENLQFSIYAWATYNDPKMKTYGIWLDRAVYVHLRGTSGELHPSGKRKSVTQTKDKSKIKYDLPVVRTQEQVEDHFTQTIEPVMGAMEAGVWYRNTESCSWCGFFDKNRERCTVELPGDSKARRKEQVAQIAAKREQQTLFDKVEMEKSKRAGLKPYG